MGSEWHRVTAEEVLRSLGSTGKGLSGAEARHRLGQYGFNEIKEKKRASPLLIFLGQFKDLFIIILLAAVVLSLVLGEVADSIVILVIVLFATVLGFLQEYRAERSLAALKKMAAPIASVERNGQIQEIPARELVPGDIIFIKTGDRIPADCRLVEAVNLKIEEASLTGESVPVEKQTVPIAAAAALGDRRNMAYAATTAVYGRGRGAVVATGMATEFGQIAEMLQEVEKRATPLQKNLDLMAKWIAVGAVGLILPLVILGVLRGHKLLEMIVWGVSLAVAAVPEALAAVVTIGLALGVQRMVKRHALVRKLPAVETLGCTNIIGSDKTGTLTQDRMTVRRIFVNNRLLAVSGVGYEITGDFSFEQRPISPLDDPALKRLLETGVLCNDSRLDAPGALKGDPTELALMVLGKKGGLELTQLSREFPREHEVPFSSERKRMTTVHKTSAGKFVFSKGAPEIVLDSCTGIYIDGNERPLVPEDKKNILQMNHTMASEALRVLGLAFKPYAHGHLEEEMIFLGLVGMIDPPREEAKAAIQICKRAGIKPVMITGDHKLTATAIARELGLIEQGIVLEGDELDRLSAEQLGRVIENVEVYARVSPAHKLKIVEGLQDKGYVVAMTGDGVNDAPALKKADIGIAMGITGTDVSKEAADMVLLDDNFASIVAAVEEGRGMFDNIKKFLVYLLSCNIGEVLVMALGILFGPLVGLPAGALPLIAIQILYVNLATDGLPAIALAVNPNEKDLMSRIPRRRKEGVFNAKTLTYIIGLGLWTGLVAFLSLVIAIRQGKGIEHAQGFCFVTLILIQFVNAFNCRSLDHSLFTVGPFGNRWLVLAVGFNVVLLGLLLYVPFLEQLFHIHGFGGVDWILSLLLALSILAVTEIGKFVYKLIKTRIKR
jgi:Ca2+-transporting ATPase